MENATEEKCYKCGIDLAPGRPHIGEGFDWLYGKMLAIKTCKIWINDTRASSGRRVGAFWVSRRQHQEMIKGNGFYAFYLMDPEEKVCGIRILDARTVSDMVSNPAANVYAIPWTRVFPELAHITKVQAEEQN